MKCLLDLKNDIFIFKKGGFIIYKIKLMNEFLHGPIWIYDENNLVRRKYPLVTEDELLMNLNEEAQRLYDECYSFDENEEPYTFDEKLYQKNYPKLKEIINSIVCRLSEINDGSFEIDNQIK